ncbi:hypothetical protein CYLTODRAFT_168218 [Cylindrobasidium torrendii FP15055 ss-10]|uniref:Velvet domain-containing protein n=1 Tax=Cylindrobasidium torrendii FP15055 ss-10 TaxID=1314674 RepID=A0A0D7BKN9_9AGAR|nr:hypothetical protein CYLTODRAFT_168218 [Cylindrobasidium torrendii FP15055 ss-10]
MADVVAGDHIFSDSRCRPLTDHHSPGLPVRPKVSSSQGNPGIFTELYFLDWTLSSTPSEYIKVLGYAFTTVLDLDGHDALLHGLQPRLRMSQPIVYLSFLASTPETRFGRQDSAWWIPPHSSNPAVLQSQYQSNILARRTEASRPYSRSRRGRDSPPHPEGPLTGCHVILDTFKNAQKASIDRGPPPENYSFTQGSAQASASSSSSSSSTSSSTAPDYSSQHPAHFVRRQPRIQVSSLLASDPTARWFLTHLHV